MEKSGLFNSISGDRMYDANDLTDYVSTFASNGIFGKFSNSLLVSPGVGMFVTLSSGTAVIRGKTYENDANLTLFVSAASGVLKRIDRVVIRLDMSARAIRAAIVQGTPSAAPLPPDLTRNDDIYELGIAQIAIPASSISISSANILDTRADYDLCGVVNSLLNAVYG